MKNILLKFRPRKIAWITGKSNWDDFIEIVSYNCNIVGGYYNITICLDDDFIINESQLSFLESYDPDIVVLSPGLLREKLNFDIINPFKIIEWSEVGENIYSSRMGVGSDECIRIEENEFAEKSIPLNNSVIAAERKDSIYNKFALVACGDVKNEAVFQCQEYEEAKDYIGYRRSFLENFIANKRILLNDELDREKLFVELNPDNIFPLRSPVRIIDMCIRLQNTPCNRFSFCNLTRKYHNSWKNYNREDEFILLISEDFDVKDASMFWNLRATGRYAAWTSYEEMDNSCEEVANYLDKLLNFSNIYDHSIERGTLIGKKVVLSSERKYKIEMECLLSKINEKYSDIAFIKYYDEYTEFDFNVPYIQKKNEFMLENKIILDCKCNYYGSYVIEIESENKKYPYNRNIEKYISRDHINLRVSKKNNLLLDVCEYNNEVNIYDIGLEDIFNKIFTDGGFGEIQISSAGKYQKKFIELSQGFENAIKFLTESPYKEILESFSSTQDSKPGWLISSLGRKVYNVFELYSLLNIKEPNSFKELYKNIDQAPVQVNELHEKGILEKGFLLTCKECSYSYWYSIENIGEKFICSRCGKHQVYPVFSLECLKLKEIIVQGMHTDMNVPLLAINYLRNLYKTNFDWIYDSDFVNSKRNLDILCNINGKIYVGEAKSCDYIEKEQFDYYQDLIVKAKIDGIIFATSKNMWNQSTQNKIHNLAGVFKGDIMILTNAELYNKNK